MPDQPSLPLADGRSAEPVVAAGGGAAVAAGEVATGHRAAHLAKAGRRSPDTIWRANPREQGLLGVTDAIAYFGRRGWAVSVPLIDSQPYDLVVDDGRRLHRVQVKTTTYRSPYGIFVVSLATRGGNRSFHTVKPFDAAASDLLYVLADDGGRWLIPTAGVAARTTLSLGAKVAAYRLAEP
ncbi:group I intron-associated PD-(D/E)XK endonuclease [Egicoccus sp. AB-alg2]|uniref:group I intron-associated PD-(D/E)XK endonuclease n=1 Tax=Egicoccus sp. AB-alg2 TaxID=3242693 RepID=UPI00359E00DA